MKIIFAADHAGFTLKEALVPFVRDELGYEVEDLGAHELDPLDDYPDFMHRVGTAVAEDHNNVRGIILGGSGVGEAIVVNRYKGVRAVAYYGGNLDIITLSREHNDANVLSLGARFLTVEDARTAVKLWLETPFSGDERHTRRIKKIDT